MKLYEVVYTDKNGQRQLHDNDFISKNRAFQVAKLLKNQGCTKIFVDEYNNDEDHDLINFWNI